MSMAVTNVEDAYKAILERVTKDKGRVVTSTSTARSPSRRRPRSDFEVPTAEADAALAELRKEREVLVVHREGEPGHEQRDGGQGRVRRCSSAPWRGAAAATRDDHLATKVLGGPRHSTSCWMRCARTAVRVLVLADCRQRQVQHQRHCSRSSCRRDKENDLRAAMEKLGHADGAPHHPRSADTENTVDTKLGMNIQVISLEFIALREMQMLSVAAMDVQAAFTSLLSACATPAAASSTRR